MKRIGRCLARHDRLIVTTVALHASIILGIGWGSEFQADYSWNRQAILLLTGFAIGTFLIELFRSMAESPPTGIKGITILSTSLLVYTLVLWVNNPFRSTSTNIEALWQLWWVSPYFAAAGLFGERRAWAGLFGCALFITIGLKLLIHAASYPGSGCIVVRPGLY
ncbi:hypothetical protein [Aquisphaera insulae]|uniref:hypothetical protein n=1 Tax=Aquisphaera insulae TaxID=2712864 RepID=UPI0013EB8436|nr:hypothetical protein [Aquisphaera insulae]